MTVPVSPAVVLEQPDAAAVVPVRTWAVVLFVMLGGAAGSLARFAVALLLPHSAVAGFPWATLAVNGAGCFLIGVVMVLVAGAHPLWRPLLGTGFLGGFTTFSTYAVDTVLLVERGSYGTAAAYVFGTLALAMAAAIGGTALTRAVRRR
ncbi:fluoride efflux transporter CrcB [Dactylosporangium sp. AC04546]|uniref:fluoride efflux transporter CrcB n=1 Tax=Dactylosporangium sp. AC04546 TaxID=2862460 RepID=UPI001EDF60E3|nr:fluoride efflux transporter CrcB [Dactylosporangium sp. AC04546]WVK79874.1 fluoride efflux transporter CrcB [Dactylosporangium sp. AC04546]